MVINWRFEMSVPIRWAMWPIDVIHIGGATNVLSAPKFDEKCHSLAMRYISVSY
jgi:hypothetical protein